MQRVKSQYNTSSKPPFEDNSYPPGFFQNGGSTVGEYGTVVPADFLNGVQEELMSVISAASITPNGNDNTQLLQAIRRIMLDTVHPVGSIFISVNASSPATLLGGTWERIMDTFLLCGGNGYPPGTTGGSARVKLETGHLPAHSHAVTVNNNGAHSHAGSTDAGGNHSHSGATDVKGAHFHGCTGERPEFSSFAGIYDSAANHPGINAWDADNSLWKTTTDGAHAHNLSVNAGGNHSHPFTTSAAGAHAHSASSANTGGGQPHENMPPYLSVYVWKRTA